MKIMKRNVSKVFLHFTLVFLLLVSLLTPGIANPWPAYGLPSDIQGHWAYSYITQGIQAGFISGYPDGTFLPDKPVSRAEFAKMVNSALGNTAMSSEAFTDVPYFEWYYDDVRKAVAATYVAGYGDGTFLPNKAISRQEASVMLARIVPAYNYSASLSAYSDGNRVADWASDSLKKMVGKKYLGAYDDGLLHPEDSLTRAQTAKILCEILDKETIVSNVTTIKTEQELSNRIYTNTVTLSKDLGDEDVTFSNCVFLGSLLVQGGGEDTITIKNCRVANLQVNKTASAVRVLAQGETVIPQTTTQETCLLETKTLAGGTFGSGFVHITLGSKADTTFTGYFPSVTLSGSESIARLEGASMDLLTVTSTGRRSHIHADGRSLITQAVVNGVAYFHGTGTIQKMEVNVNGVTYETKPKSWTMGSGITIPSLEVADLSVTFSPTNGKTGVALAASPTITFNNAIQTYGGADITATYLKNNLVLKVGSSSGASVPFTATIDSARKVITVDPTSNLASNTTYYLGFATKIFRETTTQENIAARSVVFTTLDNTPTLTFNPANGAVQVTTSSAIRITFSDDILNATGGVPNSAYMISSINVFAAGSTTNLTTSPTLSGKVITLQPPTGGWINGTTYTITVKANTFKNASGSYVPLTTSTFVAGTAAPILTISDTDSGTTTINLEASSSIGGTVYFIATTGSIAAGDLTTTQIRNGQDSGGYACPSLSGAISSSPQYYTLSGLESGNRYYIYGTVYGNGTYSNIAGSGEVYTNLPSAALTSLSYSYDTTETPGVSAGGDTFGSPSNTTVTLASSAAIVTLTATALSDVSIAISGDGVTDLGGGVATFNLNTTNPTRVEILVSGASYLPRTYVYTFNK